MVAPTLLTAMLLAATGPGGAAPRTVPRADGAFSTGIPHAGRLHFGVQTDGARSTSGFAEDPARPVLRPLGSRGRVQARLIPEFTRGTPAPLDATATIRLQLAAEVGPQRVALEARAGAIDRGTGEGLRVPLEAALNLDFAAHWARVQVRYGTTVAPAGHGLADARIASHGAMFQLRLRI